MGSSGCSIRAYAKPCFSIAIKTVYQIPRRQFLLYHDICFQCTNREILINQREGFSFCAVCGYVLNEQFCDADARDVMTPAFSMNLSRRGKRAYLPYARKRIAHFKQWLKRIQGVENIAFNDKELNTIKNEIERLQLPSNHHSIKIVLKRLKLPRLYLHIEQLLSALTGSAPLSLSPEICDNLLQKFISIQEAFADIRGSRINMLSYRYLIKKFMELEGWFDAANEIITLKSPASIQKQDMIWLKLCQKMKFTFIPTEY